jgi:hypothetical protein
MMAGWFAVASLRTSSELSGWRKGMERKSGWAIGFTMFASIMLLISGSFQMTAHGRDVVAG